MKIAIVGSRGFNIDVSPYIPENCDIVITGGATGIDACAARYAREKGIKLIEIKPDYSLHGKMAPLIRNDKIIDAADYVIAFWDGKSKGTKYVIQKCAKMDKEFNLININSGTAY